MQQPLTSSLALESRSAPVLPSMHRKVLDDQHRALLTTVMRLREAVATNRAHGWKRSLLFLLLDQTVEHFCQEEIIMIETNYPGTNFHRQLHAALLDWLIKVVNDIDCEVISLTSGIIDNLTLWFFVHLETQDASLASHLAECKVLEDA